MAGQLLALPFLVKAGLFTGGTAAVGTGGSLLFPDLFGQTVDQQAKNEIFNRTAREGKKVDRTQLGERFFDWMYGRTQEDFERVKQTASDDLIRKRVDDSGLLASADLMASALNLNTDAYRPTLAANQSEESYNKAINRFAGITKAAQTLQNEYGIDTSGFTTASEIQDATRKALKEKREKPEREKSEMITAIFGDKDKGRQHELNILANQNLQSDKVRADTQALAILNAQNNRADSQGRFQLGQMQLQQQGRRLDMEQENMNRKNTMQTIATLMQGLQGVASAGNRVMPARSYYTL